MRFLKKRRRGGESCPRKSSVQHAIVAYDSHRSAALARKYLILEKKKLWGKGIVVDWAKPQSYSKVSPLTPKDTDKFKWCNAYGILL
jgi:hypothetical protein